MLKSKSSVSAARGMLLVVAAVMPATALAGIAELSGVEDGFWDTHTVVTVEIDGVQESVVEARVVATQTPITFRVHGGLDGVLDPYTVKIGGRYFACLDRAADGTYSAGRAWISFMPRGVPIVPVASLTPAQMKTLESLVTALQLRDDAKRLAGVLALVENDDPFACERACPVLAAVHRRGNAAQRLKIVERLQALSDSVRNDPAWLAVDLALSHCESGGTRLSEKREKRLREIAGGSDQAVAALAKGYLLYQQRDRIAHAEDRDERLMEIVRTGKGNDVIWALRAIEGFKVVAAAAEIERLIDRQRVGATPDAQVVAEAQRVLRSLVK